MGYFDSDNQRAHGSLRILPVRPRVSNRPVRLSEAAPACTMRIRMDMEGTSGRATVPHVYCKEARARVHSTIEST